jgi:hypothetical protein
MKKFITLLAVSAIGFAAIGCAAKTDDTAAPAAETTKTAAPAEPAAK